MQYNKLINTTYIVIAIVITISISTAYVVNDEYRYHVLKPSASEIIGVKGQIYQYLSSTSDHTDRMIYTCFQALVYLLCSL